MAVEQARALVDSRTHSWSNCAAVPKSSTPRWEVRCLARPPLRPLHPTAAPRRPRFPTWTYALIGFTETLEIEMVAGRTFDPSRSADSSAVLINRAAAEQLGWTNRPRATPSSSPVTTVRCAPSLASWRTSTTSRCAIRRAARAPLRWLSRNHLRTSRAGRCVSSSRRHARDVERPGARRAVRLCLSRPDVRRAAPHEQRARPYLFSLFAGMALFIACLGLFGLATYTAKQRTKEIGMRKALGARPRQVVAAHHRHGEAHRHRVCRGGPLAYWGMQRWLEDFAYRFDLGVGIFPPGRRADPCDCSANGGHAGPPCRPA